jgi:hypothetical protein
MLAAGVLLLALGIVSVVGLLAFWRHARPLYVAYTRLALVLGPLAPTVLQSATVATILTFSAMACGLIIGLMYASPIAKEFRARAG